MAGIFTSLSDGLGISSWGDAEAAIRRGAGYYDALTLPELKALELKQVGELTPDMAQAFLSDGSDFQNIYVDPRLQASQMKALGSLEEIGEQGLTASDRAMLGQIGTEEATRARGARESIIQNAQARGVGGSGVELMSQMQNQQDAATRQSARDMQVAALAEQRKMQGLLQAGNMAGNIRGQDFGEQAKVAQAKDMMDRFNLGNKQNVEMANVGARNKAQQYNLATAQDLANKRAMYNAQLPQQQFQNQMGITEGRSKGQNALANMYGQQSQANMNMAGAGLMAFAASDVRAKENIELAPDEIDNFLSDLTGYKYTYKDQERHGEGERMGPMAQEMEQNKIGDNIVSENGDGTKVIDSSAALTAILGGLGRLDERLKTVEGEDVHV